MAVGYQQYKSIEIEEREGGRERGGGEGGKEGESIITTTQRLNGTHTVR